MSRDYPFSRPSAGWHSLNPQRREDGCGATSFLPVGWGGLMSPPDPTSVHGSFLSFDLDSPRITRAGVTRETQEGQRWFGTE